MKLSGPRAFWPVIMTVVAVVIASFFVAIIIATWSGGRCGRSSAEPLGTWSTWSRSTWSELGGAARDVVDVVAVDVVGARWLDVARRWLDAVGCQKCGMYVRLARLRHMHVHAGLICMLACMAFGLACVIFMVL